MKAVLRLALASAAGTIACITSPAASEPAKVALTFDDLPALTIIPDQRYVDYLNTTMLTKLRHHHIQVIGFVNEGKVYELNKAHQVANLDRWLRAGMALGNHTYSHASINKIGVRAYIADVARGEPVIREVLAKHRQQLRYFRAPYLETGKTMAIKRELDRWLLAHHYRTAPVTLDADDWEFAEPYDYAIATHNRALQGHIRAEYLAYTATRITWAEASANRLFGRSIAQVMLLHCTRLNADVLDDLIKLLRQSGLKPVGLDEALRDPVYDLPDSYVGGDGIDWLERWADERHVSLPERGNEDPPQDIQAAYDRVDNDRN